MINSHNRWWMGLGVSGIFLVGVFVGISLHLMVETPSVKGGVEKVYTAAAGAPIPSGTLGRQVFSVPNRRVVLPGGVNGYVVPENQIGLFEHLRVTDSHGKPVEVSAMKKPVFIMAYWCPHCAKTLQAFAETHVRLPLMVSTAFQPGTSLEEAVVDTESDLKDNGITGHPPVYYLLEPSPTVTAFPMLILHYRGQLVEVIGQIPNPSKWTEILGRTS